jgi:hypothetical protein
MMTKESVQKKYKNLYHTVLRNSKGKVVAVVFQDKITDEIESNDNKQNKTKSNQGIERVPSGVRD